MSICKFANLSIGIYTASSDVARSFFLVKEKKLEGSIGTILDKLMAGKNVRNCVFKEVSEFGKKLDNGTYTGAKKLLIENYINFLGRPESLLGVDDSQFQISTPATFTESLQLGQFLDHPQPTNVDSLDFLNHSLMMVYFILIGFFLTSLIMILFLVIGKKHEQIEKIIYKSTIDYLNFLRKYTINKHSLTKLNLIILSYLLFQKINLDLIQSNIKTNEVLINLDELIDNLDKLSKVDRYACWLEQESIFDTIANSDKNSYLHRILDEKKKPNSEICILDEDIHDFRKMSNAEVDKYFILASKSALLVLFSFISKFQPIKIAFRISLFNFELIQVHYMNIKDNSLEMNLKDSIKKHIEFGLYDKIYQEFELKITNLIQVDKLYTNVQEIKDDFINIDVLDLQYFLNIIISFLIINLIIILVLLVIKFKVWLIFIFLKRKIIDFFKISYFKLIEIIRKLIPLNIRLIRN